MKAALNLLPTRVVFMMLAVSLCTSSAASQADPLVAGFVDPPNAAKPRVWWHWMNGNVTKAGVRLDLEWMHRIGLGGFQNFDAALNAPQLVEQLRLDVMPETHPAPTPIVDERHAISTGSVVDLTDKLRPEAL